MLKSTLQQTDPEIYNIIQKEAERQAGEMARFGNKQVNRYLEKSKMATESEFTTSLSADSNSNAQQTDAAK